MQAIREGVKSLGFRRRVGKFATDRARRRHNKKNRNRTKTSQHLFKSNGFQGLSQHE